MGIIFFDGICGLCNRVVNFLISQDRNDRLRFATQQGELFKTLESSGIVSNVDGETLYYYKNNKIFKRSTAAIMAISDLGGGWKAIKILVWVPERIRDTLYNVIAKNRYSIFGKLNSCRVPSQKERAKFFD